MGSDVPVNLGTSWVQGTNNNPVQALITTYGIKYGIVAQTKVIYDLNGQHLMGTKVDHLYSTYWDDYKTGFMPYQVKLQDSSTNDQCLRMIADGYI